MSSNSRNSSISARRRVASAVDLMRVLKRANSFVKPKLKALASSKTKSLPLQAPIFLGNIPKKGVSYNPKQPATKKIKKIIEKNYYQGNFESAIKRVSSQNIPELQEIQTLQQYYYYVDELVTWIPEIRVWDWNGDILHERTCYLRITQFYYYFNQKELEALQSPIAPVEGAKLSPISKWLRGFAIEWGDFLDTKDSAKYLESFKYAPEYAWQDYEKEPKEYDSFNSFFARTFKDINAQRPVAQADNDRVIVFPAESTFVGQWAISTDVGEPLPAPPSIVVKHIEWPIEELLQDTKYKKDFEGGTFCHSFLNTYDYHRQHTAVAGKVLEAKFIPGQVYLEVNLEEQGEIEENGDVANAVIPQRFLDADDPTGYQFVQCRGLIVLETAIGKVAILPMGMGQVSSVVFVEPEAEGHKPIVLSEKEKKQLNYNQQVKRLNEKIQEKLVGKHFSKGEMFSYFQFGGSDCVVVFERKANVNVNAKVGVHYKLRTQYAVSNIDELISNY